MGMDGDITFTVITPAFNQGDSGLLGEAIRSVSDQVPGGYRYEHVIVDDGSTDDTAAIVAALVEANPRIRYVHKENGGVASAYSRGIEEARNEFTVFLDGDDKLTENSLALRADYLRAHPETDFVYGKGVPFYGDGHPVEDAPFQSAVVGEHQYECLLLSNFIHGGTPTVRTSRVKEIEFPEWLDRSQDYFMWLELLRPEKGIVARYVDEDLYLYRRHSGGFTSAMEQRDLLELMEANDRIRELHLSETTSWCGVQAARLNRQATQQLSFIIQQSDLIIEQSATLAAHSDEIARRDARIAEQGEFIARVENSRGWRMLESLNRLAGRK